MARRTIRTSLLWVVFAALLPLAAVAGWQVKLALADSRELVASELRANAWRIAESQRDPFIIAEHNLAFTATRPSVLDIVKPRCSETLALALQGATGIVNFVRTDANGLAQCSVLPFQEGQDMSGQPWYRKGLGQKKLYLADPQIGTISRQPVYIMVQPIYGANGDYRGTLSAGISIEGLKNSLNDNKKGAGGIALVVDGNGRPVATPNGRKFERFYDVRQALVRPHNEIANDGSDWTYVSAPLYHNTLYIVYAQPKERVTQAALTRIWPTLLLPFLAILLASLAIWESTRRLIIQWLEKLQAMTARFARGEFQVDGGNFAHAPAELADFAEDLRNMARSIDGQEKELRSALATRIALTKEVNHRVKNNLQIVNSLLAMQSDKLTDPAAKLALEQAKSRIAALGLIQRLLYEGDGGPEQGNVDMHRMFTELCGMLRGAHRDRSEINLNCEAAHIYLTADQAVPVTLFIVEAIGNAFLHAFAARKQGRIDVSLVEKGKRIEVRVADDGQGFIQAVAEEHMGMSLIHAFAGQIDGKVEIESAPSGTSLTLSFET